MRIETSKDGNLIYAGEVARSDIIVVPGYYSIIGGMKGIVLDTYIGQPDDNNDLYEMCRVMLEDGTFEDIASWDLEVLEKQERFIP